MASNSRDIALNVYINDKSKGTIKAIQDEARTLNNYIRRNLTPGTAEYNAEVKKLRGLNGQIQAHNNAIRGVGGAWDTVKKGMLGVLPSIIAMTGVTAIFEGVKNIMGSNAKLSDSFSDIRKTTGMTEDEVNSLNQSFKSFNTRTPRKELLDLSIVAGKLGIKGVSDVSKFVKAADQINVALGEDLGDIDTVVRNLGALNNLFELDAMYGTAEAMTKVGSAINSVGASGTARESALVDFTSRVGGAANSVNLLIDEVIGYGAVLDEAMVSSETSSTSISQFWIKMGQDAEKFAGIAGMEVESFRKLMAEDFNEAFIKVLEGLKSTGGGIEELAASMSGAGVDSSRMIQSLNALANNTDKLREKQKLAAEEFKKGTSLADEFAVKNENLAAKLERLNKWFTGNFISGGIVKAFEKLVSLADDFVKVPLSETLEKERTELNGLVNAIQLTNDNQELRNDLIAELQSKYPDFLGNLNAETVSNKELAGRLQEVNEQYLARIILQKKQEEIEDQAKEAAEQYDKLREALTNIGEVTAKINDELSKPVEFNTLEGDADDMITNTQEVVDALDELIFMEKEANDRAPGMNNNLNYYRDLRSDLGQNLSLLKQYKAWYEDEENALSNLHKEMEQLKGMLSGELPKSDPGDVIDPTKNPIVDYAKLTLEELKKLADNGDQTAKAMYEKRLQLIKDELDANKKMLEELALLRISMIEDDYERDLAMLEHKKQLDKQQVLDGKASKEVQNQMLLAIDEKYLQDFKGLNAKYYEIQKKEGEDAIKEDEKKRKEAEQTRYRDLVADAQMKILLTTEGTKERLQAEQELINIQLRWELNQTELTENEKLLLKEETLQKLAEMQADFRKQQQDAEEEADEQAKQVREERMQQAFDGMLNLLQSMQDIFSLVHDLRMQEIQEERDALAEKEALSEQSRDAEKQRAEEAYNDKRISRQEYDDYLRQIDGGYAADKQAREEALDKKAAKLEKEAAKRKKALSITMAIINGAAAVMQGIAQFGPPPSPAGIAAIASAVITTGVQIATITKSKFAKGGHTTPFNTFAGGGHITNTKIGMVGEEGPEWVAPNWMLRNPATANVIGMLEDMRINKQFYATGGTTASQTPTPTFAPANNTQTPASDPEMKMLMRKLLEVLNKPLQANAVIGSRDIMKLNEESDKLKASQQRAKV